MYEYIKAKQPDWELDRGYQGQAFEPLWSEKDYIFVTDEESHCPAKGTYVNLTHGLASKGQSWCSARKDTYLNYPGFINCPSEYYKKLLTDMGVSKDKLIVGGLTKFDFIGRIPQLRPIPKVLFAPTWNPELSAIAVLKDSIYEIPGVKVHLHSRSRSHSDAPQIYQKYSSGDITQRILDSDIVIGDFGSVVLEAMALGRFVIQVANPNYVSWYAGKIPLEEMPGLPELAGWAHPVSGIEEIRSAIRGYPEKYIHSVFGTSTTIVENIGHASEVIYESLFG